MADTVELRIAGQTGRLGEVYAREMSFENQGLSPAEDLALREMLHTGPLPDGMDILDLRHQPPYLLARVAGPQEPIFLTQTRIAHAVFRRLLAERPGDILSPRGSRLAALERWRQVVWDDAAALFYASERLEWPEHLADLMGEDLGLVACGWGSTRTAYAHGDLVLKVARSHIGLIANRKDLLAYEEHPELVPEVAAMDPDGLWLLQEKVALIDPDRSGSDELGAYPEEFTELVSRMLAAAPADFGIDENPANFGYAGDGRPVCVDAESMVATERVLRPGETYMPRQIV